MISLCFYSISFEFYSDSKDLKCSSWNSILKDAYSERFYGSSLDKGYPNENW